MELLHVSNCLQCLLDVSHCPCSGCMSLTVSYGCWLSIAFSHCLSGPMKMLHGFHCHQWLLAVSHCLSQYYGVAACLLLSPIVAGCLSLSLQTHGVGTCLSLSLPVPRSFCRSPSVAGCLSTLCHLERNWETAIDTCYRKCYLLTAGWHQSKSTNLLLLILTLSWVYTQLSREGGQGGYSLEAGLSVPGLSAAVVSAFY